MEIRRSSFFFAIPLSVLVLFFLILLILPGQFFEFVTTLSTASKPRFSVPTDRLRTKFFGENHPHFAVGATGVIHRKNSTERTATRRVRKVEEDLAGARASIRKEAAAAALEDKDIERSTVGDGGAGYDDGGGDRYIPAGNVYRNSRLFYR
ncbi:hypothetical protein PIB30_060203 [Stylosanthes scabra]|uniref:Uncharacterized protein n=1 Tax=Stylosanthes scabra TaxID=79078 RepID=A0ABU6XLV2_9FABA|nr:hypothetical protein [Stylosanthes scabra]